MKRRALLALLGLATTSGCLNRVDVNTVLRKSILVNEDRYVLRIGYSGCDVASEVEDRFGDASTAHTLSRASHRALVKEYGEVNLEVKIDDEFQGPESIYEPTEEYYLVDWETYNKLTVGVWIRDLEVEEVDGGRDRITSIRTWGNDVTREFECDTMPE